MKTGYLALLLAPLTLLVAGAPSDALAPAAAPEAETKIDLAVTRIARIWYATRDTRSTHFTRSYCATILRGRTVITASCALKVSETKMALASAESSACRFCRK